MELGQGREVCMCRFCTHTSAVSVSATDTGGQLHCGGNRTAAVIFKCTRNGSRLWELRHDGWILSFLHTILQPSEPLASVGGSAHWLAPSVVRMGAALASLRFCGNVAVCNSCVRHNRSATHHRYSASLEVKTS